MFAVFFILTMPRFVSVFLQEKFSAEQTVVELAELLPATDYSVTLYALYDEDPSDPVTDVATTCKTFPQTLSSLIFHFSYSSSFHSLSCYCSSIHFLQILLTSPSSFTNINISGTVVFHWHKYNTTANNLPFFFPPQSLSHRQ